MQTSKKISLQKKQILELIISESRLAAIFIHTVAEKLNMQLSDIRCLDYLSSVRSATAGEITKITGLTTGATTALLNRLALMGLVTTKTDPSDKRKTVTTLTSDKTRRPREANIFFEKKVNKLLSDYTMKEQLLIADWNKKIGILFKKEIKILQNKKK